MRWVSVAVGIGFLALATKWIRPWDTLINLVAGEEANTLIQYGMTVPDVEAIMGGEGEKEEILFFSGEPRYWKSHSVDHRRWIDATTKVVVTFEGPRGRPVVTQIKRMTPTRSEHRHFWVWRVGLVFLALYGVALVVQGLWPQRTQRMLSASVEPPSA